MNKLTPEQEKYIEFNFIFDNVVTYAPIAKYENKTKDEIERLYKNNGGINGWLTEKIYGKNTKQNRERFTKDVNSKFRKHAQEIKNKFTQDRQFGFGDKNGKKDEKVFLEWAKEAQENSKWTFGKDKNVLLKKYNDGDFGFRTFKDFYKWYLDTLQKQNHQCYYCGTSEESLKKLFKINDNDKNKPLYSKKIGFTSALQIEKLNPNKPYNKSNCALVCAFCNNAKSDMINDKNFREFAKAHIKPLLDEFINGKSNEMPFFDESDSKIYQKDRKI